MSEASMVIRLERASRWYGQVIGINDVTCAFEAGITALLGPNGAGKSTLLKLITGQLHPTNGRVTVFGLPPFANPDVFRRLGYCPEIESSYDEMTGRELVTMLGAMSGISGSGLKTRVDAVLETVGMTDRADRKVGGYSKGMRQRIKIAQGIVHNPDVLILDEPLNGLDPVGRRDVVRILHMLAEQGKCVVVSSHILHEVEQMTRRILLMSHGRVLAQGDIYEIRNLIDQHPHRISITTEDGATLARHLLELPYVLSIRFLTPDRSHLEIETHQPDLFYHQFPEIVLQSDLVVTGFDSPDNNLEAVFRYLTNK